MKAIWLCTLLFVTVTSAQDPFPVDKGLEKKHQLQKTSAILKACPDGHTKLKDVPIMYGLAGILMKEESEWNEGDKELQQRVTNREVVLGGCVSFSESPRFQPTCLECGFQYEIDFVPDDGGRWVKWGTRLSDFTQKFSGPTITLPFIGMGDVSINPSLKDNTIESVFVSSRVPIGKRDELLEQVKKWILKNDYSMSLLRINSGTAESAPDPFGESREDREQKIEDGKAKFHIDVDSSPGEDHASFTFYLSRFHTAHED